MALTAEQQRQVLARYEAGESPRTIARRLGVGEWGVRQYLRSLEGVYRHKREAGQLRWALPGSALELLYEMSPERLKELYWGHPYPSVRSLAKTLGVDNETLRRRLLDLGITVRSAGQQRRIEFRSGRIPKPIGNKKAAVNGRPFVKGQRPSAHGIARRIAVRALRSIRVPVLCWWCATLFKRYPSQVEGKHFLFCSVGCKYQALGFMRRKGPREPRPLIVLALQKVVAHPDYRGGPWTYEFVEEAGRAVGAFAEEVEAVFLDGL